MSFVQYQKPVINYLNLQRVVNEFWREAAPHGGADFSWGKS